MLEHGKNNDLAATYAWFVLKRFDQHQEDIVNGTMKMGKLALHKASPDPGERRRAAEALAMPLLNLYSALRRAALEDVTQEEAKQMVVAVLLDGEKTVEDLAAVFTRCYPSPLMGTPA